MSEFRVLELPWIVELRRALARDICEELGRGEWSDQEHSPLGRNRHVRACRRLIRQGSVDALYTDGRWLLRCPAVDREIARLNQDQSTRIPPSEPPAALVAMPPVKGAPVPVEAEDDTGVYERALLERVRGH